MRGSHEKMIPQEFADWLALASPDWEPTYPLPGDVRTSVVDALNTAQRGLCVYCGRRLRLAQPGQFHIEHFRPRSSYPELEVSLDNLFLSCGPAAQDGKSSETCGHAKADQFDETSCIEPDYPSCTRRFRFLLSGDVAAARDGDAPAESMIAISNLNHPELRKDREDILAYIDRDSLDLSDFVDSETGVARSYAHVFCEHLGSSIP